MNQLNADHRTVLVKKVIIVKDISGIKEKFHTLDQNRRKYTFRAMSGGSRCKTHTTTPPKPHSLERNVTGKLPGCLAEKQMLEKSVSRFNLEGPERLLQLRPRPGKHGAIHISAFVNFQIQEWVSHRSIH